MQARPIRPRLMLGVFLGLITGYRLLVIGRLPFSPDEAYYWAWSRRLAVCYYDQPGMVAWVDWLFSLPWPRSSVFSIRLAAVVLSAAGTLLVYRAYREYREDDREAAAFAVIFSVLPFTWLTGFLMIHDTALFPWLALSYWMIVRLVKHDGRARDWLGLAAALTGAMYSKFSAVMVAWGLFLYMLWSPKGRRWFRTWPPYAAAALAAVLYCPVLIWNAEHDWINLHAIQELTGQHEISGLDRLGTVGSYLASQVGIFSPLLGLVVFGALAEGIRRSWRHPEDDETVLPVCLALPVFLYFLLMSAHSYVYGNWPGVAYLPAAMLAMREAVEAGRQGRRGLFGRRFAGTALALNLVLVAALSVHLQFRSFRPLFGWLEQKLELRHRIDHRLDGDFGGWDVMVILVEQERRQADFILARRYQIASMLEFLLPDQPFVECYNADQRGNQWDLWSRLEQKRGQDALCVDDSPVIRAIKDRFEEMDPVLNPIIIGDPDRPIKRWFFCLGRGWKGPEKPSAFSPGPGAAGGAGPDKKRE